MNDETLHPWIEPELEARIVALVLGEASDFEREELERLIEEKPELAVFRKRMDSLHGMLRELGRGDEWDSEADWKLPAEKRDGILAVITGTASDAAREAESAPEKEAVPPRRKIGPWLQWAALIAILACIGGMMFPALQSPMNRDSFAYEGVVMEHTTDTPNVTTEPTDNSLLASIDGERLERDSLQRFGLVEIEGNEKTRDQVIRRELPLSDKMAIAAAPSEPTAPSPAGESLVAQAQTGPGESYSENGSIRQRGINPATNASGDPITVTAGKDIAFSDSRAKTEFRRTESPASDPSSEFLSRVEEEWESKGETGKPRSSDRNAAIGHGGRGGTNREAGQKLEETDRMVSSIGAISDVEDKVPLLGDLPAIGQLSRGDSGSALEFPATGRTANPDKGKAHWFAESEAKEDSGTAMSGFPVDSDFADANINPSPGDKQQLREPQHGGITGMEPGKRPMLGADQDAEARKKLYAVIPKIVGGGAEAGSTPDYRIDLELQPEAVTVDGFVRYHSEFSPGAAKEEEPAKYESKELPGQPVTSHPAPARSPGITEGLQGSESMKRPSAPIEELQASEEPFSTFSLHVSDVSFQLAKSSLAQDEWPDAARIRIEEFVNAFDYDDPMPTAEEKVAAKIEQAAHPFLQQRNVLRVAMRTAAAGRDASTPLRLTFLLDNSGSMERADRQETVRRAFALLVAQLQPNDQVTLISFARQPRLLADQVSGDKANDLVSIISSLPSEGGTNLESALQLAFEKAKEQELASAQNRIVLLTDGAANLGDAKPESLSRKIEEMREAGIAFDAAGIGTEDLNDEILEALTRKGDGRYYLLDSPGSADAGFARKIAGAFRPAAKNVKIQVEFNPDRVGAYKLLGFEKHRLKKEDFRNDKVDAAEMAAEEAGVAVYQFEAKPEGSGDIGAVSVRFLDMASGQMVERRWPIPFEPEAPALESAAPSLQLASCAALFAAKLKGDPLGGTVDLPELSRLVSELPGNWQKRERVVALREMIETAREREGR
jgi:Mg-chelatase subunit ChlD